MGIRNSEKRRGCSYNLLQKVSWLEQTAGEDRAGHWDPATWIRALIKEKPLRIPITQQRCALSTKDRKSEICSVSWKERERSSTILSLGKRQICVKWKCPDPLAPSSFTGVLCSMLHATQEDEKPKWLLPIWHEGRGLTCPKSDHWIFDILYNWWFKVSCLGEECVWLSRF